MVNLTSNKETLQTERADFKLRAPIIEGVLKSFFSKTALVEEKPFTETDIEILHEAYLEVAPYAYNRLYPSYWEYCLYSSILARKIAEKVGSDELEPLEAEALAFIGDDGSIAVPHRYARKNIVNDIFDRQLGIRKALLAKQPPVLKIIGVRAFKINNQEAYSLDDFTLPQIILDVSDNLGKINADGNPYTVQQAIEYAKRQPQTYAGGVFPSERAGLKALAEKGKQQFAIELLEAEINYLRMQFGVNVDEEISKAFEEYLSYENQQWLLKVKQAQETLDPKVDQILGRPPIQTIVFDAGGVLMKNADPALSKELARFFNRPYEEVVLAMDDLNPEAFGNKISEAEYLKKFWERMGQPTPENLDDARKPFVQPEIYQPMEGMKELVKVLAQNPHLKLYVLSDCIHAVTPTIFSWIVRNYPQIPPEQILISSRLNASKREVGSPAFKMLLEKVGIPNSSSVLFLDDNPNYATNFRAIYSGRAVHFRENDPQRFKKELGKANLI